MFARHAGAMASSPALVARVVAQSVVRSGVPACLTACSGARELLVRLLCNNINNILPHP